MRADVKGTAEKNTLRENVREGSGKLLSVNLGDEGRAGLNEAAGEKQTAESDEE